MANKELNNLYLFLEDFPKKIKDIIISDSELHDLIIEANQEQLNDGLLADDCELPFYSDASIEVFGKSPGPMTLHDTGSFYAGIEIEIIEESVLLIVGNDGKTEMLQSKYGYKIIGISTKNLSEIEKIYIKNKITEIVKNFKI